jgi:hypothetical protein
MNLYDKIVALYPELNSSDFGLRGTILLSDDGDGKAYISKWEHPTLAKPTDEELA